MFVANYKFSDEMGIKNTNELTRGQICMINEKFYIKVKRFGEPYLVFDSELEETDDVFLGLGDGKIHIFFRDTPSYFVKDGTITLANITSKYSEPKNCGTIRAEDAEAGELFIDTDDGDLAFCVTGTYIPEEGYKYNFITQDGIPYSASELYEIKEINEITVRIINGKMYLEK